MKQKILILTCGTGEGHNSAASAVSEALRELGIQTVRRDPVSFAGERAGRVVSGTYNQIIRKTPKMFGAIYRAGEAVDRVRFRSPVYFANALYAKKLAAYILQEKFDAVVCTHLFAMEALTSIKARGFLTVPSYGVLTDYTCIPFFEETHLDEYFIPHADLTAELTAKGMDKEHLIPTGIPVSPRFTLHTEKSEARKLLGLPTDKKIVLIMTGGVGCGNSGEICASLLSLNKELFLCVLAGRNGQMFDHIRSTFDEKSVRAVSFTDKVNLFMNASDVLITKPGGLSSTEAAAANIPFVALITIPGCEERNAAFFSSRGLCLTALSPSQAAVEAAALVTDQERCRVMAECQRRDLPQNAAREIAQRIVNA